MKYTFDYILSPISIDDFFNHYYEKKPLIIGRKNHHYYDSIIKLDDVDTLLSNADLIYPNAFLVKQSEGAIHSDYTYSITAGNKPTINGIIEKEKLFNLFADGHTLVINSLDRQNAGIHYLCHISEKTFNARAQANIYITPFHSQGFEAHWDTHDVFLLQISGSKRWRLYDSPIELPTKKQSYQGGWKSTTSTEDFVLEQGDLLYIPRGYVHEGEATDQVSIHLTLGIHPPLFGDLLKELLKELDENVFFRKSLPITSLNLKHLNHFKRNVIEYIEKCNPEEAFAKMKEVFISSRLADPSNRLKDYINLNSLNRYSLLRRRDRILFDTKYSEDTVELRFYNKAIKFPIGAKESIMFILSNQTFRVSAIDEMLDDQSKIVICKKLIEEGFLAMEEL